MTEDESQSGPRFCRQCGGVVPLGAALCPKCGQRWYMDHTEQQGVDLWQKIIERRAAAGLAEPSSVQDQNKYRCPNCMTVLQAPSSVCPHCGKSTVQARIIPPDNAPEKTPDKQLDKHEEKFNFPEAARGLASIKGAGKRALKLRGMKRLRTLDTIIIAAIIVIVAGIGFLLAWQFGLVPANLLPFSKLGEQQPVTQTSSAPVLSDVSVSEITSSTAIISWSSDQSTWGKVLYGKTADYGNTAVAKLQATSQKVTLAELEPSTAYHFVVLSTDGKGVELSRSDDNLFNTPAPSDTRAPIVQQFKVIPADVSAIIQWTTDEPATSRILYGTDTSISNSTQLDSKLLTDHSIRITGLAANTAYYYSIESVDAAGNIAIMDPPNAFTTLIAVPLGSKVGDRASDFTLPLFKSQDSIAIRNYRGQKILLTFWAVYCPECDRELSLLQSIKDKNIPGVTIIAIFLESKPDDIEKTISKYTADHGSLSVPVVVDMYKTTAHLYNVEKLPCTFFIDDEMIIREIEYGSFNIDQVEQTLKDL